MTLRTKYLVLMGICLGLFVLSWAVVRFYSVRWALALSGVAAVIPPVAVVVANRNPFRRR